MKLSLILVVMLCAGAAYTAVIVDKEGHSLEAAKEKRAVVTAALAIGAATTIIKGLADFFSGINGPNNVKDTVIQGRAFRIVAEDKCATVTDIDTGYKSSQCGDSGAHASAKAAEELVTLLIQLGYISLDDLHHRPTPATRPPTLCKDKLSSDRCQKHMNLGHCHVGSPYFHWMHENCYRSCAGCNGLDTIFGQAQAAGY